jgi:hypothetical protein
MAFVLNDRVKETTTTAGTGTVNLAGAETGFESFVAGIGNSNTTYYAIVHQSLDEFEVGLGTITDASPDTLARTTIISSSNSDSAVNFSAGTKDVFCTLPASKAIVEDASDNVALGAAPTISNASGDLTLDVAGVIKLDADGAEIQIKDGGTEIGAINMASSNLNIDAKVADKDIVFRGIDGSSDVTALTLDMSDAGRGVFTGGIDIVANKDIELNYGTWTGEKSAKIQAHSNNIYVQYVSNVIFRNSSAVDRFFCDASGNGYFDGNVTAYYSDERLKDKQGKIENALDKVEQIETFYFTENELAKSLGNTVDKKQVGVSAQSVKEVLPEIVHLAPFDTDAETGESKSGEDYMTVDYAKLTPLLIEAIKELQLRIKELEDK